MASKRQGSNPIHGMPAWKPSFQEKAAQGAKDGPPPSLTPLERKGGPISPDLRRQILKEGPFRA